MRQFLASLLLFLCVSARAATYASDGSVADVQSKINSASDGDTVTIPSGSFTWASGATTRAATATTARVGSVTFK